MNTALRFLLVLLLLALPCRLATAGVDSPTPIVVSIDRTENGFQLLRGGAPYFIKGVGGSTRLETLAAIGGNSFRTWGAEQLDETRVGADGVERSLLDHAHHLGLSVAVGFWMEHERHGYDYDDPQFVDDQLEQLAAFVRRFKDHPAVLLWGIGNEVEVGSDDHEKIFRAIEDAARLVKSIDPNHPTMAVVAEIGDGKAQLVRRLCPSIDILGINSYGGLPSLRERLATHPPKPYIVTEFGPLGHWEAGETAWGAPFEQTSQQKAEFLRESYEASIADAPHCLGAYAFKWGHKQERTATWYGMFLDTGDKTQSIDTLERLWTRREPQNHAPSILPIRLGADSDVLPPSSIQSAVVKTSDPDADPLRVVWTIRHESTDRRAGGDAELAPQEVPGLVHTGPGPNVRFSTPAKPGPYRLFVYVYDDLGAAATANIPFLVR